ncbi:Gldg family protein [Saccharospirillum sp. HFRX-1]|uniref:Gldg family protein n=1 Tax=unclassified Saccharospirillum TaxID=2633430 RepID=UPI00372016E2
MWLKSALQVARKEISIHFSSPLAYLFLAAFALVTVFIVFWVDAFFARNIADVRPLFAWMPVILIFLAAALTMRSWSEERRSGTLEHVLTLPVRSASFVLGKFFAAWAMLAMALLLTLPIPMMVAWIGELDWGPVWAGYLATLLLGALYLSIGLAVSARTDNALISLLVTVAVAGAFWLIGHPMITQLLPAGVAETLSLFGSGARFESITRGILDVRDLYYYLSLTLAFLAFNVYSLEQVRWDSSQRRPLHQRWRLGVTLVVLNLLVANLWLQPVTALRADTTAGQLYSVSPVTRQTLAQLQEPLVLHGYFSARTHPLLAPLIPQLKDLMREYQALGHGQVEVEFVDPTANPEVEQTINERYGIEATPFRVSDRYQSSVVSSYFDIRVQYGDEEKVLSFDDLIEVRPTPQGDIEVQLRNPEYDLTKTVKAVVEQYRAGGDIYALLDQPVTLTAYVSPEAQLPATLAEFRQTLVDTAESMQAAADGHFDWQIQDPQAGDGSLAQQIAQDYGLQPMVAGLLDPNPFYFYLRLHSENQNVILPLPAELTDTALRASLDSGLKRFAAGLNATIGLVAPSRVESPMGPQPAARQFSSLRQWLADSYAVRNVDLNSGQVPANIDLLLVMAPENLDENAVFALDQYLMRGGRVVLTTGSQNIELTRQSLNASPMSSGIRDWLADQGVTLSDNLVMDPQNAAFPLPVVRQAGGLSFQDFRMLDYPYFLDIRSDGLNSEHPATASLPRLTVPWASALSYQPTSDDSSVTAVTLAQSSPQAWLGSPDQVMPRLDSNGQVNYQPGEERANQPVVLALSGRFDSAFAGQPSPLLDDPVSDADADSETPVVGSVINRSAESARLIVIGSNDFATDTTLQLASAVSGADDSGQLPLLANLAEWSLDDSGLMSIRSGNRFNRTLPSLTPSAQHWLEYGTYAAVLLCLLVLIAVQRWRRRQRLQHLAQWI